MLALRRLSPVLALLLICVIGVVSGCSNNKSTAPAAGASGPTLGFTFPATGSSNSFTFTQAGNWNYRCIPHAAGGMVGVVIVDAVAGADSQLVNVGPFSGFGFQPDTARIKLGGTVRWVNVSSFTNHTVTRP